jgi:hypothetical protein
MGMNVPDALEAARRAMWSVGEEAKKSAGAWGTLKGALGTAAGAARGMGNSLASMIGPIGGVLAGWALGDKFQKSVFNWGASLGAGGVSTEDDIAAAQDRLASTKLNKFFETLREVRDTESLEKLKQDADTRLTGARADREGLGWNQTLEKKAVDAEIAALERFIATLDRADPARLAAIATAQEKAASDAETAEVRDSLKQLLLDAANDASLDRLEGREKLREIDTRIRTADGELGRAGTSDEKDEIAKRILDLTRQRHALLAQINAEEAEAAEDAAEKAKLASETTAHLSQILAIEAQRAKGNTDEAERMEAELEIDREIQDLRAKGVTEEALLDKLAASRREQADARLAAEKDAIATRERDLDLQIRINEATAAGDEREVSRLRWMQEYNSLISQGTDEAAARRAANASSASATSRPAEKDPILGTKGGDLIGGTNRRRGAITSDSFETGIDAGRSLLDDYLARRRAPVGAIQGKSILPADPTSSAPQSGQAAAAAKQVADALKASEQAITAALDEAAQSADMAGVESAVRQLANRLKKSISDLEKKIEAVATST